MYKAHLQNSDGDILTLTGQEHKWKLTSITGLNPPQAQVNTATVAGMDGALFNSSRLNTRNIVITLYLVGDIEANRQEIYFYARTKEKCTFYFSNENRNVYIDGYVDNVECLLFSNSEFVQISVICPYPYFQALQEIVNDLSKLQGAFTFPFSINYDAPISFGFYDPGYVAEVMNMSDSESGMMIRIAFFDSVSSIDIVNTDNNESIGLTGSFVDGDIIMIDTNKGHKSITLIRDGHEQNFFSHIVKGSTFLQLKQGYNHFTFNVDELANDTMVLVELIHSNIYRGV